MASGAGLPLCGAALRHPARPAAARPGPRRQRCARRPRPASSRATACGPPRSASARNGCRRQTCRGVVICSGNANACTGPQGLADARRMTARGGRGGRLPRGAVPRLLDGRHRPASAHAGDRGRHSPGGAGGEARRPTAWTRLAQAILTTDTRSRSPRASDAGRAARAVDRRGQGGRHDRPEHGDHAGVRLHRRRRGPSRPDALLAACAAQTFNCVSVEGHTSTNDTLLLLANGRAGGHAAAAETTLAGSARR